MRLRSHLIALVCVALVPVVVFGVVVARDNARLQLSVTERGMRETARAVARTVDKEIDTAVAALQVLGESDRLSRGPLARFHALAQRAARSQGWAGVRLLGPDDRPLLDTSVALGQPLPPSEHPGLVAVARDQRRAVVSDLYDGLEHEKVISIYVPVVRDDAVRFVLAAALFARSLGDVLRAQQFTPRTIAVLQDTNSVIVARTQGEAEAVGQRVGNPLPGQEGWGQSVLREGTPVYVAFATAPLSGWRIVLTAPVATVEAPLWRAIGQMLAGALAAAAIAGVVAFVFGRRIARAVRALVGIARAVERGEHAAPVDTGVVEVDAVAERLCAAADLARERQLETAVREQQARAIGEVAHALSASPDVDTVLRTAVDAVQALVQADSARIALVDDAGQLVLRYSTAKESAIMPGLVIEPGRGFGGLVRETGRPVRSDDITEDDRFRDDPYLAMARAEGVVSCIAVPIVTGDTVAGVIYANNGTRGVFTASDEALLETLAHHAAVAVDKARLLAREHAARAEAEAASHGKDELLAMLGHELRNPLSAITNAVGVMEAPNVPAELSRRGRDIIKRQSAHLARLVDDLLDVARVTSGNIVLVRRPLELARAVTDSVATLSASGQTARHHITLELEPVWADADEARFEQIVTNLVANAVRFTPSDGEIVVGVRQVDSEAVLTVRDSGVGIAADMLPRVFDVFVQGHRSPALGGGLGLGLTLVRRIAELHGGSVEAQSAGPGQGSLFTVRLPALPPQTASAAQALRVTRAGVRRRILIVEDNADAREMLRIALELAGHGVSEATDGPSGVAAIEKLRPDIALIDLGLPGFDGYELARRVRDAGLPVQLIALTGYGQPDDRRRAREAGYEVHLVKPVDPAALLTAIEQVMSEAPRSA